MSGMTGAPPRGICARARVRTSPFGILERPNCGHRARGPTLVDAVAGYHSTAPAGATPGWRKRVGACLRPALSANAFPTAVAHYPPELPSWQACRQLQRGCAVRHIQTCLEAHPDEGRAGAEQFLPGHALSASSRAANSDN